MRKWIVSIVAACSLLISGVAIGESLNGSYNGNPIVKVTLQGKEIPAQDVPAQIVDGRTLVPLYYLQSMGYDLTWDASKYSVDVKPTQQAAGRRKLTSQEIAKLADQVGIIYAYNSQNPTRPFSQGSGFVISPDGWMISAHHMLQGASKLEYNNYGKSVITSVDYDDPVADVMAVKLGKLPENQGKTFSYLTVNKELPQVGDVVYAIGYLKGNQSVTSGIVQSIDTSLNGTKLIRTSAFIDHGSSGGVLLNEFGDAIGVTVSSEEWNHELGNYAVPISYALAGLK